MMLYRLKKWNTLRNQIFVVFITVMVIVLVIVGIITYQVVSVLLKNNAEKQIQQTAIQASGRIDILYEHLDNLTLQAATNSFVQEILLQEVLGNPASFNQRQSIMQVMNLYQAYSKGIDTFELYSHDGRRLFPLHDGFLSDRIGSEWIEKTEEERGRMVWAGKDPNDPSSYLALRQVNLFDRWFSPGGYLLIKVKENYIQIEESTQEDEYMILVDSNGSPIISNYEGDIDGILQNQQQDITINGLDYMLVTQQSKMTNWTTVILTPVRMITEDISVLRSAIIFSGAIGFFIFLLFSFLLSTVITRPIIKLTKTMRFGKLGALVSHKGDSSTYEINELNKTYNQMVETMNHLIQVVYEKEIIRSRSELKALQAQINPHFLYNTLDALYWSLEEKGEEQLAEYVLDMSDFFRYTITNRKEDDWVTLKEELDHIERYMKIMRVRFGERLTWYVSVPEEYADVKIPKLLIQPIVENAILHGVGNKAGKGVVKVAVEPNEAASGLKINVKDDGAGMDKETIQTILQSFKKENLTYLKGTGMALVNCNKRLELYYKNDSTRGISIDSVAGKGTCVAFEIPIVEDEHELLENDTDRR